MFLVRFSMKKTIPIFWSTPVDTQINPYSEKVTFHHFGSFWMEMALTEGSVRASKGIPYKNSKKLKNL